VVERIQVPLVTQSAPDRELGALTLARTSPSYAPDEIAFVEELARRIAAALEGSHAHRAVEVERDRIEENNRAKDVFFATLSHELRTPLNSILGWTQILMRGGIFDREKVGRALRTIDRNARAQAQLIADLLDVSRIVTGKLKVEPVPIDMAPLVDAAIDAARPAAEAKGVRLERSVGAAGEVKGDPNRIAQIAGNLVSNAIKFTPPGGKVTVSLERGEHEVRLVVSDTGAGISPEFLPRVFERFRQGDSTSTRRQGGLGLGL